MFVPLHRIEKVFEDARVGSVASYAERFFETGRPDYPIERTLLASGMLDFLMRSRAQGHRRIETPQLDVSYQAPNRSPFCAGAGS